MFGFGTRQIAESDDIGDERKPFDNDQRFSRDQSEISLLGSKRERKASRRKVFVRLGREHHHEIGRSGSVNTVNNASFAR